MIELMSSDLCHQCVLRIKNSKCSFEKTIAQTGAKKKEKN